MTESQDYDLLIIGGGINGAGIARDAAGRGLRVLLCEQGDLANHTSSASTKLVHGGLRYLEYYEFGLVRKALKEREVLLGIAPHINWPLRFVMPHVRELRPAWMIRAGLFLYDHLGGRDQLPASAGVDLRRHPAGVPLDPALVKGFVYSDCWAQDARLVVLNAMDAVERGAAIWPRMRCTGARREALRWRVSLQSTSGRGKSSVTARALINASGPWVARFLEEAAGQPSRRTIQLVKGSHIVVPKLFDHDYAYIFQNTDRRVVFAIPYEDAFTLIGTTDVAYEGDPADATASADEIAYLCAAVSRYFKRDVTPEEVVWTYSGVRALYDEDKIDSAAAVSRDYMLDFDSRGGASLLSVFGGKITTYRTLAEEAVDRVADSLNASKRHWTATAALPGGDMPDGGFERYLAIFENERPWLPRALARRLARNYGTRVERLLDGVHDMAGMGACFGADLYAAELRYLACYEWAQTAEDVLWRRGKLGLRLDGEQAARVDAWLADWHLGDEGEKRSA